MINYKDQPLLFVQGEWLAKKIGQTREANKWRIINK